MCGGFFPAHSVHCPLWKAKPARICPCMPYKPLEQGMCGRVVHHALLQGLIRHAWGTSLTDVGLRVSSLKKVKISKTTLGDENKSLRAGLPKEDNELSVRGKNPPHILYTFLFINGV